MKTLIVGVNDLKTLYPEIAREWDYQKNIDRPEDYLPFSNKTVWWICPKCHSSYPTRIASRAIGYACPYCAHHLPLKGVNDLATLYPELVKEWDYEKNEGLLPEDFLPNSMEKVHWKDELGHCWVSAIGNRTRLKRGCPVCAGRQILPGFNDLATLYPDIAAEWDSEKNAPLTASSVPAHGTRKVWWICPDCGMSYRSAIQHRTNKNNMTSCSYCANKKPIPGTNDLATTHPELAKEWDYDRNGCLTPDKVKAGSERKVWWKCSRCGKIFLMQINLRTRTGAGCKCKRF